MSDKKNDKTKRSYIICAPSYSPSAGVRVLYKLREDLENRGYNAKIYCINEKFNYQDEKIFINKISKKNRQNDIVIYPEVVYGNPLLFRNVVRFLLNKPGACYLNSKIIGTGEKTFHKGELIFSFDDFCGAEYPHLRLDTIDRKLFFNAETKKDINCYFVYKRGKFRELPELKDCIEINMEYPQTKEELAKLLQRTNILYSFDDVSSILSEAALCGAKVKIIQPDKIIDFEFKDGYNEEIYNNQLNYFIEKTQDMNYKGFINRKGFHCMLELYWNRFTFFACRKLHKQTKDIKFHYRAKEAEEKILWKIYAGGAHDIIPQLKQI